MNTDQFLKYINDSNKIIVIQADNPDGDSLATSLTLENILSSLGKQVTMYCGVNIPSYLRYMNGWDRVVDAIEDDFDLCIIVDTSSISLLETLKKTNDIAKIKSKNTIIIDHHKTEKTIGFENLFINDPNAVSCGQVVYKLAKSLDWKVDKKSAEFIAYSILSDSLGLMTEAVDGQVFSVMAELSEIGINMAELDNARRELSRKSARILNYKGKLLERVEYSDDMKVSTIQIPWNEIEEYSHEYNPSMLVIDEMRMTKGTCVAVAFKTYPDGKITAKIRSNYGYKIADKLAEKFGGGGHHYASGFKDQTGKSYDNLKNQVIAYASLLIEQIEESKEDETIQHTF